MTWLESFAAAWLRWVVAASWQIAILICLVAALTLALRGASPRLRHGLWLLVLVKALLPPTLTAWWSIGAWGVAPMVGSRWAQDFTAPGVDAAAGAVAADPSSAPGAADPLANASPAAIVLAVWAAGCLLLGGATMWKYWRISCAVRSMDPIDEGPVRVELERIAARLGVSAPDLYAAKDASSPMLLGVLNPKIVLPQDVLTALDPEERAMVLEHEVMHWRRRDTWVGWLQAAVQCLFWFHPLVWLANARIRQEREAVCDELVLRGAGFEPSAYGQTLVRVLMAARGRSLVMANMVGVFDRGNQLQTRLEEVMNFDPQKKRFGWVSRLALAGVALALLPMAAPNVRAEASSAESAKEVAAPDVEKQKRPKTNWPVIVSTNPKAGATDVDPSLDAITVKFDRDMDVGGYSWTGGGEFFPKSPQGQTAVWIDKRTCQLPVRLEKGAFYRVGINSTSHQNFKSELGVPAPSSAIYFVTAGASKSVASRVRAPEVEKMTPKNGDQKVSPELKRLRVTFSVPMSTDGYSWTGGGPTFPTIPEGERPRWLRDGKTCTLPVQLEPGKEYHLGLNSLSHKNFTSKWGVPLPPVEYKFKTAEAE